MELKMDS
jgi:hypothetical protein